MALALYEGRWRRTKRPTWCIHAVNHVRANTTTRTKFKGWYLRSTRKMGEPINRGDFRTSIRTGTAGEEFIYKWHRTRCDRNPGNVHEDDIDGSLMAKYDEICPRGSVHTDRSADIDIYLRKHPGLLNLRSSTVLADDAIIADIGTENTSGPGKKAKASQRAAKATEGKKSTKTHNRGTHN